MEIWVPPTTLVIETHIWEYCRGARIHELHRLLSNGTPFMHPTGEVRDNYQHVVVAVVLLGIPKIKVTIGQH